MIAFLLTWLNRILFLGIVLGLIGGISYAVWTFVKFDKSDIEVYLKKGSTASVFRDFRTHIVTVNAQVDLDELDTSSVVYRQIKRCKCLGTISATDKEAIYAALVYKAGANWISGTHYSIMVKNIGFKIDFKAD